MRKNLALQDLESALNVKVQTTSLMNAQAEEEKEMISITIKMIKMLVMLIMTLVGQTIILHQPMAGVLQTKVKIGIKFSQPMMLQLLHLTVVLGEQNLQHLLKKKKQ